MSTAYPPPSACGLLYHFKATDFLCIKYNWHYPTHPYVHVLNQTLAGHLWRGLTGHLIGMHGPEGEPAQS